MLVYLMCFVCSSFHTKILHYSVAHNILLMVCFSTESIKVWHDLPQPLVRHISEDLLCECFEELVLIRPSGKFENGIAEGEVDASFGPLEALRLSVLTDSPVWVILSEVHITHQLMWFR